MRETLALLRGLQELDRDLFTIRRELARLPQERDRKRSQIDARIHGLKELEARLRELHVKVKDIEDLTTSQRQRMRKLEGEAASSRGDAALMVAFQHEIRSLKRDISEAEEEGLGLVEQTDTLAGERDKLEEAIAEEEKQFAEYDANIESELATARAKEEELGAKRKQRMGEGTSPDVLVRYEKLLEAREGQAMALLEAKVCQGCYVSVPSNIYVRLMRGTEIVICPSCGRILYLAE